MFPLQSRIRRMGGRGQSDHRASQALPGLRLGDHHGHPAA